jgi:hypothetical protein
LEATHVEKAQVQEKAHDQQSAHTYYAGFAAGFAVGFAATRRRIGGG